MPGRYDTCELRIYDGQTTNNPILVDLQADIDENGLPPDGKEMGIAWGDGNIQGKFEFLHTQGGKLIESFEHNSLDGKYVGTSGAFGQDDIPASDHFEIQAIDPVDGTYRLAHITDGSGTSPQFNSEIHNLTNWSRVGSLNNYPVFGEDVTFYWYVRGNTNNNRSLPKLKLNPSKFRSSNNEISLQVAPDNSLGGNNQSIRGDWVQSESGSQKLLPDDKWLLCEFTYLPGFNAFLEDGKIGTVYVVVEYVAPEGASPGVAQLKIENIDKSNVLFEETSNVSYEPGNSKVHIVSEVAPQNQSLSGDDIDVFLDVQSIDSDGEFNVSLGSTLESNHIHPPEPGIIESFGGESFYPEDCDILINGTSLSTAFGDGSGEFEENIDISGQLNVAEFNDIEITSNNLGHILAFVEGDVVRQFLGNG